MSILTYFAIIAFLIVLISVINEKWLHIQGDIVLILFSLGISLLVLTLQQIPGAAPYTSKCKWRIPSVCFAEQNGRDA